MRGRSTLREIDIPDSPDISLAGVGLVLPYAYITFKFLDEGLSGGAPNTASTTTDHDSHLQSSHPSSSTTSWEHNPYIPPQEQTLTDDTQAIDPIQTTPNLSSMTHEVPPPCE